MRDRNDQWCENEKFVNKGEASDHFIKGILFSLFILINTFFFVINILCRYELIHSKKLLGAHAFSHLYTKYDCISRNFSGLSTCDFQKNSDQISVFFVTLARFETGNFWMRLIYPNSIFPPIFCPQNGGAVSTKMRLVPDYIRYITKGPKYYASLFYLLP